MKTVHVIVAISHEVEYEPKGKKPYKSVHHVNMGMMEDRDFAVKCILEDHEYFSDEGHYPFVVLEEISLNTLAHSAAEKNQTWFAYDFEDKKYKEIDEAPDHLKGLVYYAIL